VISRSWRALHRGIWVCCFVPCLLSAQPSPRIWDAPVDASFARCYDAVAQAVVMDDGTILVACTQPSVVNMTNNAPLSERDFLGRWRVAARPPVSSSRATSLRKLSGTQAVVTWAEHPLPGRSAVLRFQVWTAGQGAAPAFAVPLPPEIPAAVFIAESYGRDDRLIRLRELQPPAVVPGPPVPPPPRQSIMEVVNRDGSVVSNLTTAPGNVISDATACQFPNGDRLVVSRVAVITNPPAYPNTFEVHAAIHRATGTWDEPVRLFDLQTTGGQTPRVFCIADGIARVVASHSQLGPVVYADLAGIDGWQPTQDLNSRTEMGSSSMTELQFARTPDGRAAFAWSDYRTGAGAGAITGAPGYQSIPRIQTLGRNERNFVGDFTMPNYDPDAFDDTAVRALAWDPRRERFVFVVIGGPAPAPKRMMVEFSPGSSWTTPIPLPKPMLESWQVDFNASGAGVLLARRHGQLLISVSP
jgi:hypothetical protein